MSVIYCSHCGLRSPQGPATCISCGMSLNDAMTSPPMKRCPYCAEEIQAGAILCRFCGASPDKYAAPQLAMKQPTLPKNGRRAAIIVGVGCLVAGVYFLSPSLRLASSTNDPEEPCVVSPSSAEASMHHWCETGAFTEITIKSDANSFSAMFRLSGKGMRAWRNNRDGMLEGLRPPTDAVAVGLHVSVVTSAFANDATGTLLGGCFRMRGQSVSTCAAK